MVLPVHVRFSADFSADFRVVGNREGRKEDGAF